MILADAEPLVRWDWVLRHTAEIFSLSVEHLKLTGIAVGLGFALAMALSMVAVRYRKLLGPISWVTGVLYTIPSLALFALLVPLTGLSVLTAEIALVGYTLLILIRNIVAGIDAVSPATLEAANAMGYRPSRILWEVQLPLAIPLIVAGLRIATVTTVGLVTVTALIAQGGLGRLILDGLNRLFYTPIIVGAVLSVVLAVVLDLALVGAGRLATPWTRSARR